MFDILLLLTRFIPIDSNPIQSNPLHQTDKVVGWGAFPMLNSSLEMLDGKFKCPLLRGEVCCSLLFSYFGFRLLCGDLVLNRTQSN